MTTAATSSRATVASRSATSACAARITGASDPGPRAYDLVDDVSGHQVDLRRVYALSALELQILRFVAIPCLNRSRCRLERVRDAGPVEHDSKQRHREEDR